VKLEDALGLIRPIPDFPKPGILFQDITPLLASASAFSIVTDEMALKDVHVDFVAGMEARGFIFASSIANNRNIGFIPIRKSGKLPSQTFSENYGLEYGTDTLEIHRDACSAKSQVLIVDDVLATGGTACAAIRLIEKTGAVVTHIVFLIELNALDGRAKILGQFPNMQIKSLKII
jgi:adenine phosphoribosyltransferase